jgi:hypothetical protein
MPFYSFVCKECNEKQTHSLSISDYTDKKYENLECLLCRKKTLNRVFEKIFSKVQKSSAELIYEITESVQKTREKIESGDTHAIRDIYGEVE